MELSWLELAGYRSYVRLRVEPVRSVNVFVGRNGSGKTNLLEAISYLAALHSFRSSPDETLVRDGIESAIVRGEVLRKENSSVIEIEIPRTGRRRVLVNGRAPARISEVLSHLRAVVFLPDDLDIVKRGPAYRRDFYDRTAVQLWRGSYLDQQEYDRSLRQRNMLLRRSGRDVDEATLAVWDDRMSQAGGKVMVRRAAVARALHDEVSGFYREMVEDGTEVKMHYESGWGGSLDAAHPGDEARTLREALVRARWKDLERKTTTVGLHRDEPWFSLDGRDTRSRASQGEQRTLALSLRLATFAAIQEETSETPLLLLDDVFSELDLHRAGALARLLPSAQTFITTAREEEVPVRGHRFTVESGGVR